MSSKKVCLTNEHNNFLTIISQEVALRYQPAANLSRDAISDPVPTSCNNQHLIRLSYFDENDSSCPDRKVRIR